MSATATNRGPETPARIDSRVLARAGRPRGARRIRGLLPARRGHLAERRALLPRGRPTAYMHGDFSVNRENTMLAKYILGAGAARLRDGGTRPCALPAAAGRAAHGRRRCCCSAAGSRGWGRRHRFRALVLPAAPGDHRRLATSAASRSSATSGSRCSWRCSWSWRSWRRGAGPRTAAGAGPSPPGVAAGLAMASKAPGVLILPALAARRPGLTCRATDGRWRRRGRGVRHRRSRCSRHLRCRWAPTRSTRSTACSTSTSCAAPRSTRRSCSSATSTTGPPWWANFWWQWKSLGTPATISRARLPRRSRRSCCRAAPLLAARRRRIGVPLVVLRGPPQLRPALLLLRLAAAAHAALRARRWPACWRAGAGAASRPPRSRYRS